MGYNYAFYFDFTKNGEVLNFLDNQLDSMLKDKTRSAAFMISLVNSGNYEMIEHCLHIGFDLEWRSKQNVSPFLNACQYCDLEMVQYLISKGANVFGLDINLNGAIHYAVLNEKHRMEILTYLVGLGLNPYNMTAQGASIFTRFSVTYPEIEELKNLTSYEKEDLTISQALEQGSYEVAYEIANSNLLRIGNINHNEPYLHHMFSILMKTALYADKKDDYIRYVDVITALAERSAIMFRPTARFYNGLKNLLLKDYAESFKFLSYYFNSNYSDKLTSVEPLLLMYCTASKLGDKKEVRKILNKLRTRLKHSEMRGAMLKYLYPLIISKQVDQENVSALFERINELRTLTENSNTSIPSSATELMKLSVMASMYFDLIGDFEQRDLLLETGLSEFKVDHQNNYLLIGNILKSVYE